MTIRQVLNKAGLPLFIHAKPIIFSMFFSVSISILASTADEDSLSLADSALTLKETIRNHSFFNSSSLCGAQMSLYAAPIDGHKSTCRIRHTSSVSSSPRVVVVVDQLLTKEGVELLLLLVVGCVGVRAPGLCALAVRLPSVDNAHAQQTCIHPHGPVHRPYFSFQL